MNVPRLLNTAWMWSCRREARACQRATMNVQETQQAVLRQIVRQNRQAEFGRMHRFDRIDGPVEFQKRVPLTTYDDYSPLIARIAAGQTNVLTRERVLLLEPTSGGRQAEKLIPYTPQLRRQFQRAIAAWMYDLLKNRPAVRAGRAYWSISPALGEQRAKQAAFGAPARIPIGFDDDTAYLGGMQRFVAGRLMAVPPSVANTADVDDFRYRTLLHLLRARDLSLISVWSPTFLTALFEKFDEWCDRLCFDLERGTSTFKTVAEVARLPSAGEPCRNSGESRYEAMPFAARVLKSSLSLPEKLSHIWPKLALISCWADGAAAMYVDDVRRLFPGVEVQPKGLLATEGCVSFPLLGGPGGVLAVRSHFFEFAELGAGDEPADANRCRLAHELEIGGRYAVVLTTGGGLYRYQLADVVEVVGFENRCPRLRFIGRADRRCDLVGEKLSELFVRDSVNRALTSGGVSGGFALLAPAQGSPPRYRLYLAVRERAPEACDPEALADSLERELGRNPHYRHAVRLEQLAAVEVSLLPVDPQAAWSIYERRLIAGGMKAGDVKPAVLDCEGDWAESFDAATSGDFPTVALAIQPSR